MKFLKLFFVLLFGMNSLSTSPHIPVDLSVSQASYAELKSFCDLIASGKLSHQQSKQLLQGFMQEHERAELAGEIVIGSLVGLLVIFGIIGCYYKCCAGAQSCKQCCIRCGICCDNFSQEIVEARRNNGGGNYLA